ncbi:TlpA family protein disulfide reductase [Flavobacteriaceae bacterium F08102]|nr:TlpA family protein disulfide reductase [Flavobacteriaceae bacterium F08102]
MKKVLSVVSLVAVFASCEKEAKVDYAILSGKIDNKSDGLLTLNDLNDRKNVDTIAVAADGTFIDTLHVKAGQYMLYDGKNPTRLYLDQGKIVNVSYDANDYKNTVSLTGEGAAESNYMMAKAKKTAELMGPGTAVYELGEAEYKAKMNEIKTAAEELLNAEGISNSFKTIEKANLKYEYLNALSKYPSYHAYYAKLPDFKVSDDFLNEVNAVDLNDGNAFKTSQAYKQLVSAAVSNKAKELMEKDSLEKGIAMIKVAKENIQNEEIRNSIVKSQATMLGRVENLEEFVKAFNEASTSEEDKADIKKQYELLLTVQKGQPSPKFVDYENHAGGTTSLDDLKGKYVYIDVWATWCGPCLAEIPSLKKVEKAYHGKNIHFVSVSIDKEDAYDKWKAMVTEKELGGIQLLADNAWESKFVQDYLIRGIPRFILIDPQGNIVNANAPRPSDPKLIETFESLNI